MHVCGRFAPSPTGLLHLGNARTALLAKLQARALQGVFLLRIEDLDPDRSRQEHTEALLVDLDYLGLSGDAPPVYQSQRKAAYAEAFRELQAQDLVYPCFCSRAEIARAASAPQGDEGPRYPGTCAHLSAPQRAERRRTRAPAWRFRVPPREVAFTDLVRGPFRQNVSLEVGDFVVFRADGVASYQLAVVVDDAAAGVTHVLRGDDLLASTPRQLLLYQALRYPPPVHAHVPLLLGERGERLAKRSGSTTVEEYRRRGVPAERLLGWLAATVGLPDTSPERLDLTCLLPTPPPSAWSDLASLLS